MHIYMFTHTHSFKHSLCKPFDVAFHRRGLGTDDNVVSVEEEEQCDGHKTRRGREEGERGEGGGGREGGGRERGKEGGGREKGGREGEGLLTCRG